MDVLKKAEQKIYRFISKEVKANMYVLISGREALIVDPHPDEEMMDCLRLREINRVTVLLTHEHPDHVCGYCGLKEVFNTYLMCQNLCAEAIQNPKNNKPDLVALMLSVQDEKNGTENAKNYIKHFIPYVCKADQSFDKEYSFDWDGMQVVMVSTPGHSRGSCCIKIKDEFIFTGDSLIFDFPVITRLPGGSKKDYDSITLPYLKAQKKDLLVLPGHGREFFLSEKFVSVA